MIIITFSWPLTCQELLPCKKPPFGLQQSPYKLLETPPSPPFLNVLVKPGPHKHSLFLTMMRFSSLSGPRSTLQDQLVPSAEVGKTPFPVEMQKLTRCFPFPCGSQAGSLPSSLSNSMQMRAVKLSSLSAAIRPKPCSFVRSYEQNAVLSCSRLH